MNNLKIKTILLSLLIAYTNLNIYSQTNNKIQYPWSDTFKSYGLSDSISLIMLSVSQGQPFYKTTTSAGLWALTPPVALHYGLKISRYTDERYDPAKSATVAAQYLTDLIQIFNNDTTKAIYAYHNGPATTKTTTDSSIINQRQSDIIQYYISETLDSIYNHTGGTAIQINSPFRISTLLQRYKIKHRHFRLLNPTIQIHPDWINPGTLIYLPDTTDINSYYVSEKIAFDSITNYQKELHIKQIEARQKAIKEANAETIYRVKSGDTLGRIARKYGVTVKQIKQWNGLKSDMIRIGQRIKIRK